jgi:hypothetical protein
MPLKSVNGLEENISDLKLMWNLACTIFYGEDCLCDQDPADISFAVIEIFNFRVKGYLIDRKFHRSS